ncbi:hypothetical protein NBRGN_038_02150 [Nocardia brasiliensis NBRC 14402]|uniref:hypothetical protein n=1 Tax=Nocardia brasiliensis TaxID=37326 RepID=UPI0002F75222|nr:hypothetical protein [Nocardia brasiliensis]GAJ81543.1 hypothetical protein NBRGN_038_02150 [Nocardia brasiliensis NBRC 14402]SUB40683.1 Uncharacterised protein [Nocardia brasiliensis]
MDRFEARAWILRRTDPGDGRYTLAEAGCKQVVDSAPGHVAQVRRLVFDPLTTAQRRHLGTTVSPRRVGAAGDRRSGPPRRRTGYSARHHGGSHRDGLWESGNMIMTTRG